MYFQQTSAESVPVTVRFKGDSSYEEMLKNRVLYRVSIARTIHFSELAPQKRSETVVSATSLKVHEHKSAGIGIEFKVCTSKVFAGHVCTCVTINSRISYSDRSGVSTSGDY
jgi:hypothetical protein